MTITRDELLTMVIRNYGFEHERTIAFANAMEILNIEDLTDLFNDIMSMPINEDEDEE